MDATKSAGTAYPASASSVPEHQIDFSVEFGGRPVQRMLCVTLAGETTRVFSGCVLHSCALWWRLQGPFFAGFARRAVSSHLQAGRGPGPFSPGKGAGVPAIP